MNRSRRLLWSVLRIVGIPEGESPVLYRDLALGFPAIVAGVMVMACVLDGMWSSWQLWTAVVVLCVTVCAAHEKLAVIAAVLIIAGIRFVFALLLSR